MELLSLAAKLVEAVGPTLTRSLFRAIVEHEDPERAVEAAVAHLAAQKAVKEILGA